MKNKFFMVSIFFLLISSVMASEEQIDMAFEHVDFNADGFVTSEEAYMVGISQDIFDVADGDQDGKLDQTEYSVAASEVTTDEL